MAGQQPGKDKPNAPWTAEQTVDYMVEKVFESGDFYVLCPDNECSPVSGYINSLSSLRSGKLMRLYRP